MRCIVNGRNVEISHSCGALLLIIVGIAILRFLVHELVRFVEISAILVIIILVLAWLAARKSRQPTANQP